MTYPWFDELLAFGWVLAGLMGLYSVWGVGFLVREHRAGRRNASRDASRPGRRASDRRS